MILYINTTNGHNIEVFLKKVDKIVAKSKIKAPYKQAEKLLPEIDKLLKKNKLKLADIIEIEVENDGGTFTSLRIGIVIANTLGFALNIPVKGTDGTNISKKGLKIVKPKYNAEPSVS